jgi:hypothetical protein
MSPVGLAKHSFSGRRLAWWKFLKGPKISKINLLTDTQAGEESLRGLWLTIMGRNDAHVKMQYLAHLVAKPDFL